MANILVHALAATAGGGKTYLRNFLSQVQLSGKDHQWTVLAPSQECLPANSGELDFIQRPSARGAARRLYMDQVWLRGLIAERSIDAIIATGNFGMLRPPVPQILLNRNALYFSSEHLTSLRKRGEIKELLNTAMRARLALACIKSSQVNIVPSAAFGAQIREFTPSVCASRFRVVPHGFDHDAFSRSQPLDPALQAQLDTDPAVRRILMVSHYNYFRNFETLLRGFALLKKRFPQPLELVLTTKLGVGLNDHRYNTTLAAKLMNSLGIADEVTMLGTVPHDQLATLYSKADVVVCPSYAESFGHPMVEAMAAGRALVASDLPVHREICDGAALHFSVFNAAELAGRIQRLLEDQALADQLGERGRQRAARFSWQRHFESLLNIIDEELKLWQVKQAAA